jgi:hypothetical protein
MFNKSILSTFILACCFCFSKAQTALPLSGLDCNGVSHDLYADLDSGKAVILHFFMASCASCPPPAQKIQAMANHILATYPGMISAYAMPFNNSVSCPTTASWVSSNRLSLYAPYDSGAAQVAHYGGFGMPTVVLLGGADHHVMFSTLSFSTSDTTIMRDSILRLFNPTAPTVINELPSSVASFSVFPNPANDNVSIQLSMKETSNISIDILDLSGRKVMTVLDERQNGMLSKQVNTNTLSNGNYLVRLLVNGQTSTQKLNILH